MGSHNYGRSQEPDVLIKSAVLPNRKSLKLTVGHLRRPRPAAKNTI